MDKLWSKGLADSPEPLEGDLRKSATTLPTEIGRREFHSFIGSSKGQKSKPSTMCGPHRAGVSSTHAGQMGACGNQQRFVCGFHGLGKPQNAGRPIKKEHVVLDPPGIGRGCASVNGRSGHVDQRVRSTPWGGWIWIKHGSETASRGRLSLDDCGVASCAVSFSFLSSEEDLALQSGAQYVVYPSTLERTALEGVHGTVPRRWARTFPALEVRASLRRNSKSVYGPATAVRAGSTKTRDSGGLPGKQAAPRPRRAAAQGLVDPAHPLRTIGAGRKL